MIWLAWRMHRSAIITALVFFGILATFILVTGLMAHAEFTRLGLAGCLDAHPTSACLQTAETFLHKYMRAYGLETGLWDFFNLVALVTGIMVGAPLVARELERKTNLLVWAQGITRSRWLAGMLFGVFAGGLLLFGAISLLFQWWLDPLIQIGGRLSLDYAFDFIGIVQMARVVFALALGIAAGALFGKTLPAILVLFLTYLPLRLFVQLERPYRPIAPLTVNMDPAKPFAGPESIGLGRVDWIVTNRVVDGSGQPLDQTMVSGTCSVSDAYNQCLKEHGWMNQLLYHPDAHFWPMQFAEAGIFIALAVALLALTFVVLRRRDA